MTTVDDLMKHMKHAITATLKIPRRRFFDGRCQERGAMTKATKLGLTLLARYLISGGGQSRSAGIRALVLPVGCSQWESSRGTSDIIFRLLARADPGFVLLFLFSASLIARVASYLRGVLPSIVSICSVAPYDAWPDTIKGRGGGKRQPETSLY